MLRIAKDSQLTDVVSEDGSNPITTQHPIEGSQEVVQVYLFNSNGSKRYEGVSVKAVDTVGSDESGWVELSTDGTSYESELSMGDIDDTQGKIIYVRVTTPQVEDTQNKTDIKLTVEGTEYAV